MKTYGGVFLTSAVHWGEWSASCSCRFSFGERAPSTQWIRGKAGLDALAKRKIVQYLGIKPVARRLLIGLSRLPFRLVPKYLWKWKRKYRLYVQDTCSGTLTCFGVMIHEGRLCGYRLSIIVLIFIKFCIAGHCTNFSNHSDCIISAK
jgi:hypothetical protein